MSSFNVINFWYCLNSSLRHRIIFSNETFFSESSSDGKPSEVNSYTLKTTSSNCAPHACMLCITCTGPRQNVTFSVRLYIRIIALWYSNLFQHAAIYTHMYTLIYMHACTHIHITTTHIHTYTQTHLVKIGSVGVHCSTTWRVKMIAGRWGEIKRIIEHSNFTACWWPCQFRHPAVATVTHITCMNTIAVQPAVWPPNTSSYISTTC